MAVTLSNLTDSQPVSQPARQPASQPASQPDKQTYRQIDDMISYHHDCDHPCSEYLFNTWSCPSMFGIPDQHLDTLCTPITEAVTVSKLIAVISLLSEK